MVKKFVPRLYPLTGWNVTIVFLISFELAGSRYLLPSRNPRKVSLGSAACTLVAKAPARAAVPNSTAPLLTALLAYWGVVNFMLFPLYMSVVGLGSRA
jgi:hypothetical protein